MRSALTDVIKSDKPKSKLNWQFDPSKSTLIIIWIWLKVSSLHRHADKISSKQKIQYYRLVTVLAYNFKATWIWIGTILEMNTMGSTCKTSVNIITLLMIHRYQFPIERHASHFDRQMPDNFTSNRNQGSLDMKFWPCLRV